MRRGEPTELDLLVRVHTPDLPAAGTQAAARPPLNLALVLDRSGSMGGQKMDYARQAAAFAVDQLRAEDRVSVVAFDDRVETVVASTPAADKARLKAGIARIDANAAPRPCTPVGWRAACRSARTWNRVG